MLKKIIMLAAIALTASAQAMTTTSPTLFKPTDGDVNLTVFTSGFGTPPTSWQLGLFDDDVVSGGSVAFGGADHLALNLPGDLAIFSGTTVENWAHTDSLSLTGDQTFLLALDTGSGWSVPDTVSCFAAANSCNLTWNGAGFALVADVAPVPLPAALPLLLGALFGIGAIQRRVAVH